MWRATFVVFAFSLFGCFPSVYQIDGSPLQNLRFELEDGTILEGDEGEMTESHVLIHNWNTAGRTTKVQSAFTLNRNQILKVTTTKGRDVTARYAESSRGERYLGRIADAQSRLYNLTVISVVISIATAIALISASSK